MLAVPPQTYKCTREDGMINLAIAEPCTLLDLKRWGNAYAVITLLGQMPPLEIFGPGGALNRMHQAAKPAIEVMLVDTFQIDFSKAAWRPNGLTALGILKLIDTGAGEKSDSLCLVALQMLCTLPDILLACVEIDIKGGTFRWMVRPEDTELSNDKLRLEFGNDPRFDDEAMWVEDDSDRFYGRSTNDNRVLTPADLEKL